MKTFTKFLVCLLIVPFAASLTLHAEDEIPNNEIWYTSTDGKVVTPYKTNVFGANIVSNTYTSGKGVIKFDGDVTRIGSEAFLNSIWASSRLANIIIPNSVTSIELNAFLRCNSLTSITIPNSVTSIGRAFSDCSSLTSITIPNSVKSIDEDAFYKCSSLASIIVESGNINYDSRDNCNAIIETSTNTLITGCKNTIIPNSVTGIGGDAFHGCTNLTSITIPNSVTSIGHEAFYYCTSLKSVTIGHSVESIGEEAFACCDGLTSIIIPNSVTNIGVDAFVSCDYLASVTMGNSVTSIGKEAFYGCKKLTTINIPNSVTSIGSSAFADCSSLPVINDLRYADTYLVEAIDKTKTTYNIKDDTNWIGHLTFSGCNSLVSINIPNSVTKIEDDAFSKYSLASIIVESGNTNYDSRDNCNAIIETSTNTLITGCKNTIIPNSVTSIRGGAFSGCSRLTSITIPNSVTNIGSGAFYGCSRLASVNIGNSVTSIGDGAFRSCDSLTSITIPNSVTSIGEGAFYWCRSLTTAIIGKSVTSIGKEAFYYCDDLTSVIIGNSVMNIGSSTFQNCSKLCDVYCNSQTPPSCKGDYVFRSTPSSKTLHVPSEAISNYSTADTWRDFSSIVALHSVFTTNMDDVASETFLSDGDDYTLTDNLKNIEITENIPNIHLTYTRNFTTETAGNWQAWYMPCDFDYGDLSEQYDVAEVAGVLFDQEGNNYVAFNKMTEGKVKAHTPYVVKAKASGDIVVTTTTDLEPTADAKSFAIQSAYNNFTFSGVYENSYLSASSTAYALNKSGDFAAMASDVYLRPFRIYMRITDRDDNPYAAVTTPPAEVKVVVLGEDDVTGLESLTPNPSPEGEGSIYNLSGQKLQQMQRGINIVNGKKVLY